MANINRSRVLLVSLPSQGHVPSLFNLASRLVAAADGRFTVTLVNIESVHRAVAAHYPVDELSDKESITLESLPFNYVVPKAINADFDKRPFLEAFDKLQEPFDALISRLQNQGVNICCIISDYFVQWTAAVAANRGITHVSFWPGSTSWCLVEYHLPLLVEKKVVPVKEEDYTTIDYVQGMEAFRALDLPFGVHEHAIKGTGLSRLLERQGRLETDSWILANSFFQLEPEQDKAMQQLTNGRFLSVGPLVPLRPGEKMVCLQAESPHCIEWLDKQAEGSVLYISFGSLATLPAKQVEELMHGLELSKQAFLWVVRPEFVKDITGEEFMQGFKERTQDRALIVSCAPQYKVLSHAAVGGFLTHCGWNSVLESICCGVPMLGWSCYSEQNLNCRLAIVTAGVGLSIGPVNRMAGRDGTEVVTRDQVAELVVELMHGHAGRSARIKVKWLSEDARKAVERDGTSQNKLKKFVESLL